MIAAQNECVDVIRTLLDRGADVNAKKMYIIMTRIEYKPQSELLLAMYSLT